MPERSGGAAAVPVGCPGRGCAAPVVPGGGRAPSAPAGAAKGGERGGETHTPPSTVTPTTAMTPRGDVGVRVEPPHPQPG